MERTSYKIICIFLCGFFFISLQIIFVFPKFNNVLHLLRPAMIKSNAATDDKHTHQNGYNYSSNLNILVTSKIKFLPNFKNPCWYGTRDNGPINDGKLHCLPSFFIIGFMKTGTTDLFFKRIHQHPQFEGTTGFTEAHWLTKIRFMTEKPTHIWGKLKEILRYHNHKSLAYYTSMFDIATEGIEKNPTQLDNGTVIHDHITGEKTPALIGNVGCWRNMPENAGLDEPRYITLHMIKHLVPNAKIIIQMRDPVTRLLSNYHHSTKHLNASISQQTFHDRVMEEMDVYKQCLSKCPMRTCIYQRTKCTNITNNRKQEIKNATIGNTNFHFSFYAFYMKEILSVFPKEQVLPVLTEDLATDIKVTLKQIFKFLGLRVLSELEMDKISQPNPPSKRAIPHMFKHTEDILYDFFRPFNQEMATLMNSTKYLYPKPTHR